MSVVSRIAAEDQTVIVVVEDDYAALLSFFGSGCSESLDYPDSVVLLDGSSAARLANALTEAVQRMSVAA